MKYRDLGTAPSRQNTTAPIILSLSAVVAMREIKAVSLVPLGVSWQIYLPSRNPTHLHATVPS